jgi:hypothetical protein
MRRGVPPWCVRGVARARTRPCRCHVLLSGAGEPCPAVPCAEKVRISCACGRLASEVACGRGSGDAEKERALAARRTECREVRARRRCVVWLRARAVV